MEIESKKKAERIAKLLGEHLARDVEAIEVSDKTPYADYYVLATAPNERALGAYAEAVEEAVEKDFEEDARIEGLPSSGWIIVDAKDVVVHLFLEEEREKYGILDILRRGNDSGNLENR